MIQRHGSSKEEPPLTSMSTFSNRTSLWWDREHDGTGRPLRLDVRNAAHEVWGQACARVQAILGDSTDAAMLMERSVSQVSRYLDRRGSPLDSEDTPGLLMCALCRAVRHYALKLRRMQLVGNFSEFYESPPRGRSCAPSKEDCRLDAEKAARRLSPRARTMLDLRRVGFEWKEIAEFFKTTDCAARAEFSREVKKAKARNSDVTNGNDRSTGCQKGVRQGKNDDYVDLA
jgi:DNA-directed RNA polymerase specialized sigma24 family protein